MARIVEGDAGKIICKEAVRLKPAAVVMGTRGRGLVQRFFFFFLPPSYSHSSSLLVCSCLSFFCSFLQGSASEYCFHHCKVAPVIIVPGKGTPTKMKSFCLIHIVMEFLSS